MRLIGALVLCTYILHSPAERLLDAGNRADWAIGDVWHGDSVRLLLFDRNDREKKRFAPWGILPDKPLARRLVPVPSL